MHIARQWKVRRLLLTWLCVFAFFALLRWALTLGVYRTALEGHRVIRVSGLWTAGFASVAGALLASVATVSMVAVTISWWAGKRERKTLRSAALIRHRKVLK